MFEYVEVDGLSADQALDVVAAAERDRRLAEVQQGLAILRVVKTYRRELVSDKKRLGSEGTPLVDEFACLEVAAVLRRDPGTIAELAADLLDLEARLPRVWEQAVAGGLPLWVARKIARAGSRLTLERALWLDATVAPFTTRLGVARLLRWVEALVVEADPAAAELRAEQARSGRTVWVGAARDGVKDVYGRVDVADGVFLDGMLARLSDILAAEGSTETVDERRATALGILATPARALAMLQAAAQPTLQGDECPSGPEADECSLTAGRQSAAADFPGGPDGSVQSGAGWIDGPDTAEPDVTGRGPAGCVGHVCGTITIPPDKLLPTSTLLVHLTDKTLIDGEGLCRVEGVGPVTLAQLKRLLGNTRITIRPVVHPDGVGPVDCYEIPAAVRRAVLLRHPFEVWPYGTRPSRGLDLDHTRPYTFDGTRGQTRLDNLGPLSRKAHRAKTHAGWRLTQPEPGRYVWRSPLGRRYIVTTAGLTLDGAHPQGTQPWDDPIGGPLLPTVPPRKRTPRTSARRRDRGTSSQRGIGPAPVGKRQRASLRPRTTLPLRR